jgi:pilus assembly protein CpaB
MKPKTMLLMVVAVGCGLAASYMTSRLLADRNKETEEARVTVVVSKGKVSAFQPIKDPEKYFTVKEVPESAAPKKAVKSLEDIKDQRLARSLVEDEYLTTDHLLNKDLEGMEGLLPKGMRAVAIKVNPESLVGGFVRPNSHVDVIFTPRGNAADVTSKVILQDMLVLAVDQRAERDPNERTILGNTVTIAAKLEEAQRLALASSTGELRLTLRALGDTDRPRTPPVRYGDLEKPQREGVLTEDGQLASAASPPVPALPALPVPPKAEPKPEPKAEPKVEQPKEEPKEEEPPAKTHVMSIQNGEYFTKVVFVEDPKEGWKNASADDGPRKEPPPRARKEAPAGPMKEGAPPAPGARPGRP